MRAYIKDRVKQIIQREPRTLAEFRELVKLVLSRVIMFNAKRGGECSKMTIKQFNNPTAIDARKDYDLSGLEDRLCDRFVWKY